MDERRSTQRRTGIRGYGVERRDEDDPVMFGLDRRGDQRRIQDRRSDARRGEDLPYELIVPD